MDVRARRTCPESRSRNRNLRVRIRHVNTAVDDGPGLELGALSFFPFLAWTRLSLDKEKSYGVLVWSRRWIRLTFRTFVSRFRLEAIYGNRSHLVSQMTSKGKHASPSNKKKKRDVTNKRRLDISTYKLIHHFKSSLSRTSNYAMPACYWLHR